MKRILPFIVVLSLLFIPYYTFSQSNLKLKNNKKFKLQKGVSSKDYLPNTLIVKFRPLGSTPQQFSISQEIQKLKIKSGTVSTSRQMFKGNPMERISSKSTLKSDLISLDRIFEIKYKASVGIESVINEVLENPNIEYAEPSYIYHTSYVPNDPLVSSQSNYLSQIKAFQAWDINKNSSNVVIAIVDAGSDLDHEDLADNIFININDPINGLDDDADGFVDNNRGWDFIGSDRDNFLPDNNPGIQAGANYHGTHVSGIASAVSDNAKGVASVAFNAKLLIVKVGADNDVDGGIYNGYDGIKYAADHGAQIINCSWGGAGGGQFGQSIIDYAISKNCLIVAAAGNEDNELDYPAAYTNVMAVASVDSLDVKSSSSNYGFNVDISAPGAAIYSTITDNNYGPLTGTSMSAPVVSSVAALVKGEFPSYTMQQVGEQVRVTSDNIDNINPSFIGLIGTGRVNAFRALTESSPSVRIQKITLQDQSNGSILAGDTLKIYLDITNFLQPANNLIINLSTDNPNVQVIDNQLNIGLLGTLESKNLLGPFRVLIKPATITPTVTDNEIVNFRVDYASNGTYADSEFFAIPISLDYQNIEVNKISTTITSIGRIGYRDPNATTGIGFSYKGHSLLYEAALMIGNSNLNVSNNARNASGSSDEDFVKQVRLSTVLNSDAAYEARSEFNDSGNDVPLNLYIKHTQLAYSSLPDDKYTIAAYEVQNKGTTDLKNIYIGYFTDWDISEENKEVTKYDVGNKMGYVYSKIKNLPYAGVKLLRTQAQANYFPLSDQIDGDLLVTDGGFSISDKYKTLSSGIKSFSLGDDYQNGLDVSFVISSGPFNIPTNQSINVAFAFIAGDNLYDLQLSSQAAQAKYNLFDPSNLIAQALFKFEPIYPNPAFDKTFVKFSIPNPGFVTLTMYNMIGKKFMEVKRANYEAGSHKIELDISELENGLYFCEVSYNNMMRTQKLLVSR